MGRHSEKEYKSARARLDALDRAERKEQRAKQREGRPRRERRLSERLRLLNTLVPDRVCPECGHIRLTSRSWVLYTRTRIADTDDTAAETHPQQRGAMCRSCWWKKGESNE